MLSQKGTKMLVFGSTAAAALPVGVGMASSAFSETSRFEAEVRKGVVVALLTIIFVAMNALAIYAQFSTSVSTMPAAIVGGVNLFCLVTLTAISLKELDRNALKKEIKKVDIILKITLLAALVIINTLGCAQILSTPILGWVGGGSLLLGAGLHLLTKYRQDHDPDYIKSQLSKIDEEIANLERIKAKYQYP